MQAPIRSGSRSKGLERVRGRVTGWLIDDVRMSRCVKDRVPGATGHSGRRGMREEG